MIRRPLTVMLALGLAAATAGCTTFSDNDAVARVGDVSWSTDEFRDHLSSLGATSTEPLSADAVRGELTTWILAEMADAPVDDDALAARYDRGMNDSGAMCLQALVVEEEDSANDVLAALADGLSFDEAVTTYNIDAQLAESGGKLPCVTTADVEGSTDVPFIATAMALSATDPAELAPLQDTEGNTVAWVIARLRSFAELTSADLPTVRAKLIADVVDIHVDPRYGTFDPDTAMVVALG